MKARKFVAKISCQNSVNNISPHIEQFSISPQLSYMESWNFSTWQFFLHEYNSWYSWQISDLCQGMFIQAHCDVFSRKNMCWKFACTHPWWWWKWFQIDFLVVQSWAPVNVQLRSNWRNGSVTDTSDLLFIIIICICNSTSECYPGVVCLNQIKKLRNLSSGYATSFTSHNHSWHCTFNGHKYWKSAETNPYVFG